MRSMFILIFNYFNCNIEENCPVGCPCSDFDCVATTPAPTTQTPTTRAPTTQAPTTQAPTTQAPTTPAPTVTMPGTTTATTGNAVLVLNTLNSNNKPMVVDFNGVLKEFFLEN